MSKGTETTPHAQVNPEIIASARKAGMTPPVRAWYVLRHADANHDGDLDMGDAIAVLQEWCDWSMPSIRRVLRQGEGMFWMRETTVRQPRTILRLRGIQAVADALDVPRLNRRVSLPLEFFTSASGFNAGAYFAEVARHRRPISRATLAELTGQSSRSQRRHRRGKHGVRNRRRIDRKTMHRTTASRPWRAKRAVAASWEGRPTTGLRRRPDRLPDSYTSTLDVIGLGIQARTYNAASLGPGGVVLKSKHRRYFPTPRSYVRCNQKGKAREDALLLTAVTAHARIVTWESAA